MEKKKKNFFEKKCSLTYSHLGYAAAITASAIIATVSDNPWYGLATLLAIYAVGWCSKGPEDLL